MSYIVCVAHKLDPSADVSEDEWIHCETEEEANKEYERYVEFGASSVTVAKVVRSTDYDA